MATIQADTSGFVRYRLRNKGKTLQLDSTAVISAPSIFPGCPVPAPTPPAGPLAVLGYGLYERPVLPANPNDPALAAAGFKQTVPPAEDEAEQWGFFPSECEAGADLVIPLDAPAVAWGEYPQGLRLEASLWRSLFANDDSSPPQSYWLALADETGDNLIAFGWLGSRETSDAPGLGVWVRYNGVDVIRQVLRPANMLTTGGAQLDATITRVGGGVSGRRAVLIWDNHTATQGHADNILDSMAPITNWGQVNSLLRTGAVRPSLIITHRAGGPEPVDRLDFFSYRWS